MKEKKVPITITISPDVLRRVDKASQQVGLSRSSYLSMVLTEKLREEEKRVNA